MAKIKTITRDDIECTRFRLLRDMHRYIITLGDEEIYESWIMAGVPDEPSDEDFDWIASNDDEWIEVCGLFGRLVKRGGFLNGLERKN